MNAAVKRHAHLDTKAMVLLVFCCAFWGFQQILIKSTVVEVPPLWQASIRFMGATLCLLAWCYHRRIRLFEADGSLLVGLLAGILFAAEFVFIYTGLQYTAASRLTVFLYTSPFWVAVFLPYWVPTESLRKAQWLGLSLAFGAVALAFGQGLANYQNGQWRGDLLGLCAGMFWGVTTLVLRSPRLATLRAEKTLFYQVATTTVVAPLLSWVWGEPWRLDYSAHAWGSIALQTVVGAFGTYLIWMWLLRHYPATRMASFTFLSPVFALTFGVALLGEPLSPQLVTALSGVAVGIWLVNRRAR
jgi:drug/metabolite transporter (DMT)-like permease